MKLVSGTATVSEYITCVLWLCSLSSIFLALTQSILLSPSHIYYPNAMLLAARLGRVLGITMERVLMTDKSPL